MTTNEQIEIKHKAILFAATASLKCFPMSVAARAVFCGGTYPDSLFRYCYNNVACIGGSIVAVIAVMDSVLGYYVVRLKSFDKIFARMIKADFIITAMFFGAAFTAPAVMASKVMIWLFSGFGF